MITWDSENLKILTAAVCFTTSFLPSHFDQVSRYEKLNLKKATTYPPTMAIFWTRKKAKKNPKQKKFQKTQAKITSPPRCLNGTTRFLGI